MIEIKIKIDEDGNVYAEMPNGTIRELVADVYNNPFFGKIMVGNEVIIRDYD